LFNLHDIEFWPLLAGLGLFLFGMHMLENAIKQLAGRSFKLFLRNQTNHTFKAISAGALVTAVLQSSSLVTLLVMSLAGAGVLGLKNGVGMIMGANLGTTFTGWLVSFIGFKLNIEAAILPFIAIGGLMVVFIKNENWSNAGKLLMGFSLLFLGLDYMKNSFANLSQTVDLSVLQNKPMILFTVFGFALTALIQSSSASMTIYLSSLSAGLISLEQAAFLVIGSDLGTTITGMIGSLNGNAIAKKVGWAQFLFNLMNGIIALFLVGIILKLVGLIINENEPLYALVLFHSFFNFFGILLFSPFLKQFTGLLEKIVKSDKETLARFINEKLPRESSSDIELFEMETKRFIETVISFNTDFFMRARLGLDVNAEYFRIKQYESEISEFYISLHLEQLNQNEIILTHHYILAVRNAAVSAKDLKDIKHNIAELENSVSENAGYILNQLYTNQEKFSKEIKSVFQNIEHITDDDLHLLDTHQKEYYEAETNNLYNLIKTNDKEINTSSCLNIFREVSVSNESLIKSIRNLKPEINHNT
jgi:phosphate:Na+ symporter